MKCSMLVQLLGIKEQWGEIPIRIFTSEISAGLRQKRLKSVMFSVLFFLVIGNF